jgi:hypothetical protein
MAKVEGECQGKANSFCGSCDRKPSVVRDGKPYCWQHDPERLQKLAKERWELRKQEIAKVEADQDARIVRRKLEEAAGVDKLTNDTLGIIIRLGGIQQMIAKILSGK